MTKPGASPSTKLMIQKLAEMASRGLDYETAAAEAGVSYHYVAGYASKYGIEFTLRKRGRPVEGPNIRSEEMRVLYQGGATLLEIGQKYGITRERVRQIISKNYGLRAPDGGSSERCRKNRAEFQKRRDAKYRKDFGCSFREYKKILKHAGRPTYAYVAQRRNARVRDIRWELNLWQWWKLWDQSGHWSNRGRGRGYCMCRLNDVGPYSVDNVYIATGTENLEDYWVNRRASETLEVTA